MCLQEDRWGKHEHSCINSVRSLNLNCQPSLFNFDSSVSLLVFYLMEVKTPFSLEYSYWFLWSLEQTSHISFTWKAPHNLRGVKKATATDTYLWFEQNLAVVQNITCCLLSNSIWSRTSLVSLFFFKANWDCGIGF